MSLTFYISSILNDFRQLFYREPYFGTYSGHICTIFHLLKYYQVPKPTDRLPALSVYIYTIPHALRYFKALYPHCLMILYYSRKNRPSHFPAMALEGPSEGHMHHNMAVDHHQSYRKQFAKTAPRGAQKPGDYTSAHAQ